MGAWLLAVALATPVSAGDRPGRPSLDPWSCPPSHPIKGYAGQLGRIYFVPADPFYDEASPERCYASEDEARRDGSRPRAAPPPRPAVVQLTPSQGRRPT